jgi:hypothetical protein
LFAIFFITSFFLYITTLLQKCKEFFIRLQKLHGYSDKPTVANLLAWPANPCPAAAPPLAVLCGYRRLARRRTAAGQVTGHTYADNQAYHFGCEEGHTIFMARPSKRVYEK